MQAVHFFVCVCKLKIEHFSVAKIKGFLLGALICI